MNISTSAILYPITLTGSGKKNSVITKKSSDYSLCTVNLSLVIEGYYNLQQDKMRIKDTVSAYLWL